MSIKDNIIRELTEIDHIADGNTPTRRFFRCWLDGSYNGEEHYKRNCEYVREHYSDDKALRRFIIPEFVAYMACDHDCSESTARAAITEAYTTSGLEELNLQLIDDARDLVRDEMEL